MELQIKKRPFRIDNLKVIEVKDLKHDPASGKQQVFQINEQDCKKKKESLCDLCGLSEDDYNKLIEEFNNL